MKYLLLSSLFFLLLTSCSKDELVISEIYGEWKLSEVYIPISGWSPPQARHYLTLNNNGTFESNQYEDCKSGTFKLSSNKLTLMYPCPDFESGYRNNPSNLTYEYSFEDERLFLRPIFIVCYEGCGSKYEKGIKLIED